MSKFEYTEDMVTRMESACASGVTEDIIETLCDEFEFPRRSVTAKLRKLGFDVPKKPGAAPVFSADETDALAAFLAENSGVFIQQKKLLMYLLAVSLLLVRSTVKHCHLK